MLIRILGLLLLLSSPVAAAGIQVTEAWYRDMIPGQSNTVAYLSVTNSSSKTRQLVSVESSFSKKAELHTNIFDNGMARMRPLDSIKIDAQGQALFAPGGHHIMLLGVSPQLPADKNRSITLVFSNGERVSVALAPRRLSDSRSNLHMHHQH